MTGFAGFPEQALVFYEGLRADNSKAYWSDHRATYDRCVKAPMEALLAQLEPEFGPATFFRPYRDVRFSKDKTPYKDHAAAVVHGEDPSAGALYVQLSADGLLVGGGYWHTQTDQARRLRAAIADDLTGTALQRILDDLVDWELHGERLKRLPKEHSADHPRAGLLTLKSLAVTRGFQPAEWLHEAECGRRVGECWRAVGPLNDWLRSHVGASRNTHGATQ